MELLRTCSVLGTRDTVVDTRAGNLRVLSSNRLTRQSLNLWEMSFCTNPVCPPYLGFKLGCMIKMASLRIVL